MLNIDSIAAISLFNEEKLNIYNNYGYRIYKKIWEFKIIFLQRYEKVIEKTKVLTKKDNSQVPFYNLMGLSYRQLGKNDFAEDIFRKGLKKFPNNISILSNLGALYRVLGRYSEAEEILIRALKQNEKSFVVLCNLANIKRERNQNNEAIELYERLIKLIIIMKQF